jgi:erythromycin esterase-like protein
MYLCPLNSWNLRDTHFFDTMERVIRHLKVSRGGAGRVVLWAHNSHLGDARYTHLDQPLVPRKVKNPPKDLNIGQLVKEKYPLDSITVGQLFNTGRVCCADDWGEPHLFKPITPALANSHENVLHAVAKRTGQEAFALDLTVPDVRGVFKEPRLQRAIGVIYRPQTERWSHYYFCDIAKQFDLVVFFETTSPVLPLVEEEVKSEEAETYPSGL